MGTWPKLVSKWAGHLKDQDYAWAFEEPQAQQREAAAGGASFVWVERVLTLKSGFSEAREQQCLGALGDLWRATWPAGPREVIPGLGGTWLRIMRMDKRQFLGARRWMEGWWSPPKLFRVPPCGLDFLLWTRLLMEVLLDVPDAGPQLEADHDASSGLIGWLTLFSPLITPLCLNSHFSNRLLCLWTHPQGPPWASEAA